MACWKLHSPLEQVAAGAPSHLQHGQFRTESEIDPAPAALPPEKTQYPLYRRLGGPQGRFWWFREISPPPVFDSRTIQPVVSSYIDLTIPAHYYQQYIELKCMDPG
jgi:hypothetical protein